ncbi:hypothetical protein EDB85DRAFT_2219952 [Lactarius pseudohatsudake]|nr:hypothetical protein EDB85DRAFT_2219952 [Lactarius pseudohatsudake]
MTKAPAKRLRPQQQRRPRQSGPRQECISILFKDWMTWMYWENWKIFASQFPDRFQNARGQRCFQIFDFLPDVLPDQTRKSLYLPPNQHNMVEGITKGRVVAQAHIAELLSLSPPVTLPSPISPAPPPPPTTPDDDAQAQARPPLDTPDELALHALLLSITHCAAGHPTEARRFLRDAHARIPSTGSTWIGAARGEHDGDGEGESGGTSSPSSSEEESVSSSNISGGVAAGVYGAGRAGGGIGELKLRMNALAVHDGTSQTRWRRVLKEAEALLDSAMSLSGSEVDLSSRVDTGHPRVERP